MTLTEYCTGIADAIREKEGSAEAIPAPDHAARIKALSTSSPSDYIEVTMTNHYGYIYYITERGDNGEVNVGETVTAKVYRGVVNALAPAVLPFGNYKRLVRADNTVIFVSDGGTLETTD